MTKETMRAEVATRVKNLSATYCREADAAICRCVTQSEPYRKAKTVFCYVGRKQEIDTMALLRAVLRDGKALAVPLCLAEKGRMEARRIAGLGDLVSGRYGILAPKLSCPVIAPEEIDLAIVPCCTGNATGQRLGYGGGYYDRYLLKTKCPTMLLCRHQLERSDIPVEPHDVRLDYFVTERGVVICKTEDE